MNLGSWQSSALVGVGAMIVLLYFPGRIAGYSQKFQVEKMAKVRSEIICSGFFPDRTPVQSDVRVGVISEGEAASASVVLRDSQTSSPYSPRKRYTHNQTVRLGAKDERAHRPEATG